LTGAFWRKCGEIRGVISATSHFSFVRYGRAERSVRPSVFAPGAGFVAFILKEQYYSAEVVIVVRNVHGPPVAVNSDVTASTI
jgi:hypothetical protein